MITTKGQMILLYNLILIAGQIKLTNHCKNVLFQKCFLYEDLAKWINTMQQQ